MTRRASKCPSAGGPGRNTGGQRYRSLNVGEKRLGQRAKGGLGRGPEEAARKGLTLSGPWQARTVRAANHTECNLYNWRGQHRNSGPLQVAGLVGGATGSCLIRRQERNQAGAQRQTGQSLRSDTERVKPESRAPPAEGGSQRLRPPPRSHSKMASRAGLAWALAKSLSEAQLKDRLHLS